MEKTYSIGYLGNTRIVSKRPIGPVAMGQSLEEEWIKRERGMRNLLNEKAVGL